ncbi:hypothetical protein [Chitinolyticbacter albus]|uniref:hypothetical protein n=1 Tax=Chitinolyticbacter albus TaxID=2961951 RepID=UPI00210868E1|nr:hypothetical protein [Chitinolyticbacter albus]
MAYGDYENRENRDANRDPVTDEPGSHPLGTGVGAAIGGVAGIGAAAAAGAAIGPVGAALGAAAGAVAGGLAGSQVGEVVNPTEEDEYWRSNFHNEPYVEEGSDFERYAPAYRTGYLGRGRYPDSSFEASVTELRDDYYANRGDSDLEWDDVREAARASWQRIDERSSI